MTDQELIKRLGGVKTISQFFNFKHNTVNNWVHRGIPAQVKVDYQEYFLTDDPKPLRVEESPFVDRTAYRPPMPHRPEK